MKILNYIWGLFLFILVKTVQTVMSGGHDHYMGVNE